MESLAPIALFGVAGFCMGGVYAMHTQRAPVWATGLLALFAVLCAVAGWLYL
ncbi:MAG TPA: hypothetical protein VFX15_09400 [Actinomycetes bacterium]|nr:hypothetical protein [Actinomycetes bacterium]